MVFALGLTSSSDPDLRLNGKVQTMVKVGVVVNEGKDEGEQRWMW